MNVSIAQISAAIGRPTPTAEQTRVIEAAPSTSALVVAGAGSGKTETMALRVLWLVANGHVLPDEVLGLTFTRKAAGELRERIDGRLHELAKVGLLPSTALERLADHRGADVTTYNAFANQVFRERALLVGVDPDARILGDSAAWLIMHRIVERSDDARLADLELGAGGIVQAAMHLAGELGEHDRTTDDVRAIARSFVRVAELEPEGKRVKGHRDHIDTDVRRVGGLLALADLVDRFRDEKDRLGAVQFSDQVRFARHAARRDPSLAEGLRARVRAVLLDEYQDTSFTQTQLLSELFHGVPVMAVGDPNQAIYGFRGASAANLQSFGRDFDTDVRFALTTSWRNDQTILDVANGVASGLVAGGVGTLHARPNAPRGAVEVLTGDDVPDQARRVADWLFTARADHDGGALPTAAILLRSRAQMSRFADALFDVGIPYEVVGRGGLQFEPEIADLVAALKVIDSPDAESALIRLLVGAHWRIGIGDLAVLRELARRMAHHERTASLASGASDADVAGELQTSIVEALDELPRFEADHPWVADLSDEGRRRLLDASARFSDLRRLARVPLGEFVRVVERSLLLDIEVAQNPHRPRGRANLDAFAALALDFEHQDDVGTLGAFLAWLDRAAASDELDAVAPDPQPGVVQILTVHGAKGLEWDLVAVPELHDGGLPTKGKDVYGWLSLGRLPFALRGDVDALPEFRWQQASDERAYATERAAFADGMRARHLQEERRLAYVAFTRARHALLLAWSPWADAVKPRDPSPFLIDAWGVLGIEVPEPRDRTREAERETMRWPVDPLGDARAALEAAAQRVRAATSSTSTPEIDALIDALLAERDSAAEHAQTPRPVRIAASGFKDWVRDPEQTRELRARPMPTKPYRATRLGTLFHAWVEHRGARVDAELIDASPDELDVELIGVDAERLATLQATFEASEYAGRQPDDVEIELHLPVADMTVVCRIDAVYADGERFTVVDWKTGALPVSDDDERERELQLALYRHAYAAYRGVDPELVDAELYFVEHDRIVRPAHRTSAAELAALWRSVQAG